MIVSCFENGNHKYEWPRDKEVPLNVTILFKSSHLKEFGLWALRKMTAQVGHVGGILMLTTVVE